jgi:DNA-binding CsgD family transcriptional regulator
VLFELGMAEALVDAPAAAAHLRAAQDGLTSPADRGVAAQTLARILLFTASPNEARRAADEGAAGLPSGLEDLRLALEATALYATHFRTPDPDIVSRMVAARSTSALGGLGARMLVSVAAWNWALTGGSAESCVNLAVRALEGGQLIAADPGFMAIIAISVVALAGRDEALPAWEEALDRARRVGSLDAVSGVHIWSGWTWLERGELKEAWDSLTQALEASRLWNPDEGSGLAYAVGVLGRVLVERGEFAAARETLDRYPNPIPGSDSDNLCLRSRIELLLAEGALADATQEADRYADRHQHVKNPAWSPWRSLRAMVLSRAGRRSEGEELLEAELAAARQWGAPGATGRALRLLGSLRRSDGIDLLREAVEMTAGTSARLEHAKALAALGAALRRARRLTEAREPLQRALELAMRCGSPPVAALARSDLLASGARPRRRQLQGVGSLTPSERRVVDLAAYGGGNREIAESLYITPKTVEAHLSSAYQKLGIRSRRELAIALKTQARD